MGTRRVSRKYCKICGMEVTTDSSGRCKGCADAKAATDAGMTYGKYKAIEYARQQEQERKQQELVARAKAAQKAREAERKAKERAEREAAETEQEQQDSA